MSSDIPCTQCEQCSATRSVPFADSILCLSPAGSGRISWSGTRSMTAPCLHPTLLPTSTASMTSCKSSSPLHLGEARDGEEEPSGVSQKGCPRGTAGQAGDHIRFGGAVLGCPRLMPSSSLGMGAGNSASRPLSTSRGGCSLRDADVKSAHLGRRVEREAGMNVALAC